MADVQVNQTPNGRGSGMMWGALVAVLLVILILVFLIFSREPGPDARVDVDLPDPAPVEVPRVEAPEVKVPDKVEVELPDKVEVDVNTTTQKTST